MKINYEIRLDTLDCPYGCGEKLALDEDGNATCPTDTGWHGNDCEGEGVLYKDADAVCYAVNDRVSEYKKSLGIAYAQRASVRARIDAQEKRLEKAIKLSDRISNQHG